MMRILLNLNLFFLAINASLSGGLSFEQAMERTLDCSPQLQAARAEVAEVVGVEVQSGLYYNPEFSYSVENIFGNKHWKGWDSAESRYELSQQVQLGGQRGILQQAAAYHRLAAEAGYAGEVIQVVHILREKYIDVAVAQERVKLKKLQLETAINLEQAVIAKVEAGKAPLIEKNKARISKLNTESQIRKNQIELDNARHALATMWGATHPDFDEVNFPMLMLVPPPPLNECVANLETHPILLEAQFEHWAAYKEYEWEKSMRIPDAVLMVGYKTLKETGERGMILGASIPLPLFNRNQGNIHSKSADTIHMAYELYDKRVQLEAALSHLHKDALYAYNQAKELQETLLQLAKETFEGAHEGFVRGKTDYIDMLDAERTFFEVQENELEARAEYFRTLSAIEWFYE